MIRVFGSRCLLQNTGPKEKVKKKKAYEKVYGKYMKSINVLEDCVGTAVWEAGVDGKVFQARKLVLAMEA